MPFNTCLDYKVPSADAAMVWQSFGEGGAFIAREGGEPFTFATGQQATLKLDAERLRAHREIVGRLLGLFAVHPCVVEADALSFVPNGVAGLTGELGRRLGKGVIKLFRPEGAPRTDIRFASPDDEDLARNIGTVCAIEDISRTGFSAHITAGVLRGVNPDLDIHTLSMLQRDAVEPSYTEGADGATYHTFVRRDIPLAIEDFRQQFPDIHVETVA